jgi:hypothetical protein
VTAVTALRMTRATWYKHRFSAVGLPAVFLLAALALFADGAGQRHWLGVHHLAGCLVADNTTGGSWCVASAAWASFSNPSQTPNIIAAAILALPALAGLFAGVPWVAREFESGAFRFTWTQGTSPRQWLLGTFGPLVLLSAVSAAICGAAAYWWYQIAQWQDGGEQRECLDGTASLLILGRLPAAQPPDRARARPRRHPRHGRRPRRVRVGVVAPHPAGRLSRPAG